MAKPIAMPITMNSIQLPTRLAIRRIAKGFQPVQCFTSRVSVDLDPSILVRAQRRRRVSAFAAFEQMHIEPQAEQVEPCLGGGPTLKAAFDRQIGAQNAVDRFGRATGPHDAFQEIEQGFGQLESRRGIRAVVIAGHVVARDGQLTPVAPQGRVLRRNT